MLEKIIPHRYIYLFFLSVLLFGLSMGKIFMSIGTIGITVNWVFEGNFQFKIARIKKQKYSSVVLSMGYLIHVLWLLNTQNFNYAGKDLLVKLPLLLIPLVIGSTEFLNKKELKILTSLFVFGVLTSTLLSMLVYFNILPPKQTNGVFQISLFMSHIRMGLLVAFTSILLFYLFFFQKNKNKKIILILAIWLVVFLFFLQSITAIIAWLLGITILVFSLKNNTNIISRVVPLFWLVGLFVSAFFIGFVYKDFYTIKDKRDLLNLPEKSTLGEVYVHDTINNYTENGYYVWVCIAPNEVKESWNKRSNISIDSIDSKGQKIRSTLYRYLTSKGLNKDAKAINTLTKQEVKQIESGITSSIKYSRLEDRIRGIFLELQLYRDGIEVNNHSVSQRLLFTQVSKSIIKDNFLFGVGIGDINDAFKNVYLTTSMGLSKVNQKRSHNQFLSFFIVYGLVGFLLWLFTVVYPIFVNDKPQPIYWIFLVIILIGFISDDMLERQAGVAIYITLNSLILYGAYSVEGGSKVLDLTKRTPNINS